MFSSVFECVSFFLIVVVVRFVFCILSNRHWMNLLFFLFLWKRLRFFFIILFFIEYVHTNGWQDEWMKEYEHAPERKMNTEKALKYFIWIEEEKEEVVLLLSHIPFFFFCIFAQQYTRTHPYTENIYFPSRHCSVPEEYYNKLLMIIMMSVLIEAEFFPLEKGNRKEKKGKKTEKMSGK